MKNLFSGLFEGRIIKKKDMISDAGVHQKGNHVDVFVITICVLVSGFLVYLGIMALSYNV